MANFQPINFAAIGPVSAAEQMNQGLQLGYSPFAAAREAEKQRLANELTKIEMQYAPEVYEADIGYRLAGSEAQSAQAALARAQMQMFQQFLNDMQNDSGSIPGMAAQGGQEQPQRDLFGNAFAPQQRPGQMSIGAAQGQPGAGMGAPRMPSMGTMAGRQMAGLPTILPQEQKDLDLYYSLMSDAYKRNFETTYGTQTNLSDIQKQQKGIQTLLPLLDELRKEKTPSYLNPFPGNRAAYNNKVYNAMEKLMVAENWKGTEGDKEEALAMLKRLPGESDQNYHKRLDHLYSSMLETNKILDELKYGMAPSSSAKSMPGHESNRGHVKMRFPDGAVKWVPAGKIEHFMGLGGQYAE